MKNGKSWEWVTFGALLAFLLVCACGDNHERGAEDASGGQDASAGHDASGEVDSGQASTECGGCSSPPMCNPDGSSPPAPCSCGCVEGDMLFGGICSALGCIQSLEQDGGASPGRENCEGDAAESPSEPVVAPGRTEWEAATAGLPMTFVDSSTDADVFPLAIDPATCTPGAYSVALGFGSAYAQVVPHDSGDCQVWLGGETEDPSYMGEPSQYCRFPQSCREIEAAHWGDGGPAWLDSPYCSPRNAM